MKPADIETSFPLRVGIPKPPRRPLTGETTALCLIGLGEAYHSYPDYRAAVYPVVAECLQNLAAIRSLIYLQKASEVIQRKYNWYGGLSLKSNYFTDWLLKLIPSKENLDRLFGQIPLKANMDWLLNSVPLNVKASYIEDLQKIMGEVPIPVKMREYLEITDLNPVIAAEIYTGIIPSLGVLNQSFLVELASHFGKLRSGGTRSGEEINRAISTYLDNQLHGFPGTSDLPEPIQQDMSSFKRLGYIRVPDAVVLGQSWLSTIKSYEDIMLNIRAIKGILAENYPGIHEGTKDSLEGVQQDILEKTKQWVGYLQDTYVYAQDLPSSIEIEPSITPTLKGNLPPRLTENISSSP